MIHASACHSNCSFDTLVCISCTVVVSWTFDLSCNYPFFGHHLYAVFKTYMLYGHNLAQETPCLNKGVHSLQELLDSLWTFLLV